MRLPLAHAELGLFNQEEHAVMGQREFARLRPVAPAHQPGAADGLMREVEGALFLVNCDHLMIERLARKLPDVQDEFRQFVQDKAFGNSLPYPPGIDIYGTVMGQQEFPLNMARGEPG